MIQSFFLGRELRRYPFFFLLLSFTLSLGTLGLTGISIVSEQVRAKLKSSARELLTSDLVVSARRDLLPDEKETVNRILKDVDYKSYRVFDIYSMVTHRKSGQTRLVEIRSIEDGFPFYGKITLLGGSFDPDGFFISKDLAELWGMSQGDEAQVGALRIKIRDIILEDSSQGLRGFSLAPRVYLPLKQVEKSGLLRPGSTGSFGYHYSFENLDDDAIQALKEKILEEIPDTAVRVTLPEGASEQTGRVLGYLTDFMALAALIGLILSLVGVFYLYQSHLVARLKDLCLLNLHGLPKSKIISGILLQFSLVFLAVYALQLLLLLPLYNFAVPYFSGFLNVELSQELSFASLLTQMPLLYGLSVAIIVPLLFGLLRTSMGLQLKLAKISLGRFRFWDFLPFLVFLWGYACFVSHSLKTGSLFFLALLLVFLLSTVTIKTLQLALRRLVNKGSLRNPSIEMGIALRNITRSGHKLTLSFLSLAMGATLISLILQLDGMIQEEFTLGDQRPALFLFDIQEDQLEPLQQFARKLGTELDGITPLIRARLEGINGEAFKRVEPQVTLRTREDEVESRFRNRGLNLTYRGHLSPAEKIVAGEPFPDVPPAEERLPWISLESRFASRLGIQLGDRVNFEVQGIEVEGIVRNFREIKWTSFYPNFFVNVEPGYIDEAPKTYLAVLPTAGRELKARFQREAVPLFPNISFIDVEEIVAKLSDLFQRSRLAIEVISWLSLGVGLIILYGLSHDQVYRRYYDLALMKSLGFSSGKLRLHLLLEFGTIFFTSMLLGFTLGWAIAQAIGREVFKLSLQVHWDRIWTPALFLMILCLLTLFLSSWRAVKAKPRELLSDS